MKLIKFLTAFILFVVAHCAFALNPAKHCVNPKLAYVRANVTYYTVVKGDTLSEIALEHGNTSKKLYFDRINAIERVPVQGKKDDMDHIYVGQTLILSSDSARRRTAPVKIAKNTSTILHPVMNVESTEMGPIEFVPAPTPTLALNDRVYAEPAPATTVAATPSTAVLPTAEPAPATTQATNVATSARPLLSGNYRIAIGENIPQGIYYAVLVGKPLQDGNWLDKNEIGVKVVMNNNGTESLLVRLTKNVESNSLLVFKAGGKTIFIGGDVLIKKVQLGKVHSVTAKDFGKINPKDDVNYASDKKALDILQLKKKPGQGFRKFVQVVQYAAANGMAIANPFAAPAAIIKDATFVHNKLAIHAENVKERKEANAAEVAQANEVQ